LEKNVIKPDFIDIERKLVIEFDGTYWHDVQQNPAREYDRDQQIINAGYKVFHIKEFDYNQNKQLAIQQCLNFLNQ
jgi:very-short-patch-repair endonuclease